MFDKTCTHKKHIIHMSSGKNATMLHGCNNNWFFSDNCLVIGHLVLIGIIYHYECVGCNC